MYSSTQNLIVRPVTGPVDLLALHTLQPRRYPYLLESAARGTPQGCNDILFAYPGDSLVLKPDFTLAPGNFDSNDFLDGLDSLWSAERIKSDARLPVFAGGWFIFLGYDLAQQIEPKLKLQIYPDFPVAFATRIPAAVIVDHEKEQTLVVAEPGHAELIADIEADISAAVRASDSDGSAEHEWLPEGLLEEPAECYCDAVERAKRYIYDGDIFQANLSRLWQGRLADNIKPSDVYRRLRKSNPGPFAGLACFDNSAIISSSPERLLQLAQDLAQTRPIAGTRPRGNAAEHDRALSKELISHPKERAEHIMLIDLERNDLGRICRPGTVRVDELMAIESYAHVHHIVSNVRGRIRRDVTPGQAMRAVFPGGTITGAPKVRCMEIISELEQGARGPFYGAMGYLGRDGNCDLNILIRSLLQHDQDISFRAGGGIVADSQPQHELNETRAKAKGLLIALGIADA